MINEGDNHISFDTRDLKVEWFSGTGAGGQYRNKHQNSVRMTHIPSGLQEISQCRSRTNSYNEALEKLQSRIEKTHVQKKRQEQSVDRKLQVGSGMRGDKIRTYRFQDNVVIDHRNERKHSLSEIMKGNMSIFWKS